MILEWQGRNALGQYSIVAEAGEYDAIPPIDRLIIDRDMMVVNNDSLSLAATLAFGQYCSGTITMPRKVSAEFASAVQSALAPTWVQVSPVDLEPFAAPLGSGFLFVSDGLTLFDTVPNRWGTPRNSRLTVLDSTRWAGSILSTDSIAVSSNAHTLSQFAGAGLGFLPFMAVGVLFMESLRCGTMVVPDDAIADDGTFVKVSRMVGAANFGLLRESEAIGLLEA